MKQRSTSKPSGFSLIELVVVIIIISTLAVVAIPRFMNLQGDATMSTLQGVKGALESAASITYAKSALQGEQKLPGVTATDTELTDPKANGVYTSFGYPEATSNALLAAAILSADGWTVKVNSPGTAIITPANITSPITEGANGNGCNVTYVQAADKDSRPIITVYGDGC